MPSGLYTFNIDNFQISQTRSAHTDTVYVSVTVKVGTETPPLTAATPKSLGNLDNGRFNTGVSCPNVAVGGGPVVFNYLIVNAGSSSADSVISTMKYIGETYANDASNLNLPPLASSLASFAQDGDWQAIFKPGSCDGVVAAEQNTFTLEELQNYTARTPYFTQGTTHIGTRAGSGCNSNGSKYLVNWSMANVADLPDVRDMAVGAAADTLLQAGFRYQQTKGKGGYVNTQSPSPTQLSDTHPVTETVTLTLKTTQS